MMSDTLKPYDRYNVRDEGTDKNILMEYIEEKPCKESNGVTSTFNPIEVPSRYNPIGDRCDA